MAATVETPCAEAADCAAAGGMVPKPFWFWTMRSLLMEVSSALVKDALRPLAKTATKTTTPSPIMSAAEVTAVRPGLRTVFSTASRPEAGARRCIGQPSTRALGRTRYLATMATPRKTSSAPTASMSSCTRVGSELKRP